MNGVTSSSRCQRTCPRTPTHGPGRSAWRARWRASRSGAATMSSPRNIHSGARPARQPAVRAAGEDVVRDRAADDRVGPDDRSRPDVVDDRAEPVDLHVVLDRDRPEVVALLEERGVEVAVAVVAVVDGDGDADPAALADVHGG